MPLLTISHKFLRNAVDSEGIPSTTIFKKCGLKTSTEQNCCTKKHNLECYYPRTECKSMIKILLIIVPQRFIQSGTYVCPVLYKKIHCSASQVQTLICAQGLSIDMEHQFLGKKKMQHMPFHLILLYGLSAL